MKDFLVIAVAAGVTTLMLVFMWLTLQRYITVGPNEALVVSGRQRVLPDGRVIGFRIVTGGRVWPIPFLERVNSLSLEVQTVELQAETRDAGQIPTRVAVVAQVRIRSDARSLGIAAGLFLSKTPAEVGRTAARTIEDHLKSVIATLRIEELSLERARAAELLREEAAADLEKMGLEVVSLTISKVEDDQGYLDAIAKEKMARVKRDAVIAQAEADREAAIEIARNSEIAMKARFEAEGQVAAAEAQYLARANRAKDEALPDCAECGADNLPEAKFCCQCGRPFRAFR
jgi:flotillin